VDHGRSGMLTMMTVAGIGPFLPLLVVKIPHRRPGAEVLVETDRL